MTCRLAVIFALALPAALAAQDQRGLSLDSLLSVPVSSASKHLQTVRDAPASVTIITAEEIELFGWTDLAQLLSSVGGFYSSYDRNYTYLGVRGFGRPTDYNNRLLLLVNGHTINEGFWGSTAAGPDLAIDLRSLARIEVVRGPGSVIYGNNAVFAVVNLITKEGADIDGAQVRGTAGSWGNYGGSIITGTRLASSLDLFATGSYAESDGQTLRYPELADDPATGGTIRNLDWEKRGGALLRAKHDRTGLSFMGRFVNRTKGIPTASYEQIPGDPHASTLDRWTNLELGLARELTPTLSLNARAYYDAYHYEGEYAYDPVFNEVADHRVAGGEAILRLDLGPRYRITVGSEYRDNFKARYRYPPDGPAENLFGEPYRVWSAFAQAEIDVASWLTLVVGGRNDDHSMFESRLTPRGAIVLRPDRVTSVKLLYGEAFRFPTVSEGTNGGIPASGTLAGPEEIRTIEALVQRQASRGLLLTAGAYRYRMLDIIEQVLDPTDSAFVFRNAAIAEARGVYGSAEWEGQGGTHLYLVSSYTYADRRGTDEQLTNSPSLMVKLGVGIPLPADFGLGIQSRYEDDRLTLAGSRTDDAIVTDLYLRWRPSRGARFEAGLRVNNVTDANWATPGGVQHLQAAIPQDGRNLLLMAGLRF